MLLFPLQGKRLGWLLLLSAAALLFQGVSQFSSALAMGLGALWWLVAFKLASDALTETAFGRESEEGWRDHAIEGVAVRQVVLGVLLIASIWVVGFFAGPVAELAAFVGLVLLLPAMVMVLVMQRSLLRALDPGRWFELLRRVGSDYVVLALKLTALAAVVTAAFLFSFASLPPWLGTTMLHFAAMYSLFAGYHAMGTLLGRHHVAPDFPAAEAPVEAQPAATEEELALAECDRLVASGRADEGAAVLDRYLQARGGSAAVHARYRELLTGLGDSQGLLRHANDYVAALLHQGKDREAMALYLASRAMYGDFELQRPQQLRDLINAASRNQQENLAAALSEELARRFPNHATTRDVQ